MKIPKYDEITLPFLRILADKNEHSLREIIDSLANDFKLTEEEISLLLPSGQQPIFDNRVGWARTYMKKASLLEATKRGHFVITPRGLDLLQRKPSKIDAELLTQYEGFKDFISPKRIHEIRGEQPENLSAETPLEVLENAFIRIKESLADDLLKQIQAGSPILFEKIVVELLVQMGYGGNRKDAGEAVGKRGDEGIDGIIKEDPLGLDIIYIQAKKWDNTVSRPEVQKFAGALQGQRARKGIFISTSTFSKEAREYVKNIDSKIILIDGKLLTDLMIEHNIGVSVGTNYQLKRLNSDYFIED